jgi:hypothetical protein
MPSCLRFHIFCWTLPALTSCAVERGTSDADITGNAAEVNDASFDVSLELDAVEAGAETFEALDDTEEVGPADDTANTELVDDTDNTEVVDDTASVETLDDTDNIEALDDTDSVETNDVTDADDAVGATGELVVRIADDVNQDGFITPMDALLLLNGGVGGVVGAEVSVFDGDDVLVADGLTAANPSPLVFVLVAGCYRVEAGDRATPLLSVAPVDGLLCIPAGGREFATFLDVPADLDEGG